MQDTIIHRLRSIGFTVSTGETPETGGFIVRTIRRAKCEACDKPNLYSLYEVVFQELQVRNPHNDALVMKWTEQDVSPLGSFCNTCGAFSEIEGMAPCGGFAERLVGAENMSNVLLSLENIFEETSAFTFEQLKARAERLEIQLESVKRQLASRKGYRD